MGEQSYTSTLQFMNNAKVFLHTSSYEGNATVLMEALYNGCKVISTRPLANQDVDNLTIKQTKDELVNAVLSNLKIENVAKRVVFNTMGQSAKNMLSLFN